MTGRLRADSPSRAVRLPAGERASGARAAGQRPVSVARSVGTVAALAPVATVLAIAPRWQYVLAVLIFGVGGVVKAIVASMMPQESGDRLTWWREWLRHRERMAETGIGIAQRTCPPPAEQEGNVLTR